MKILVLSFYYPPDLSAGSFRTEALVEALLLKMTPEDSIDIITTCPNRYKSYIRRCDKTIGARDNIRIRRIKVPQHNSRFIDQSICFFVYFSCALSFVFNKKYDLIYATSSRLFTCFLGAVVARMKRIPLYLDIRDIFTDSFSSVFNNGVYRLINRFFLKIEQFSIKTATSVNVVSPGFIEYFRSRYSIKHVSCYTNGIDPAFLSGYEQPTHRKTSKKTILYAGNIGGCQALEKIIPDLAKHFEQQIVFQLIGDGTRRKELESLLIEKSISNVIVIDPVERDKLKTYYMSSDYLFLHLDNTPAFLKVIPSKIFEYAATNKPIIAGLSGVSKEFMRDNISGCCFFDPCNIEGAISMIEEFIKYDHNSILRSHFIDKYSRQNIMNRMSGEILNLLNTRSV